MQSVTGGKKGGEQQEGGRFGSDAKRRSRVNEGGNGAESSRKSTRRKGGKHRVRVA